MIRTLFLSLLLASGLSAQTIAAIAPDMTTAGTPDMPLRVYGSGFDRKEARVIFAGVELKPSYASGVRLDVTVPESLLADDGLYLIQVRQPGGESEPKIFEIAQGTMGGGAGGGGSAGDPSGGSNGAPSIVCANCTHNSVTLGTTSVGSTSAATTVSYLNSGTAGATISAVTLTGGDSSDFAIADDGCTGALAQGASCNVDVTFSPASAGTKTTTLRLSYDGGAIRDVTLTASGQGEPLFQVSPSSLDFGTVAQTQTATLTATIDNPGTADLTVSAPAITTGTHYSIVGGTCQAGCTIAPAGSATVIVQFAPQSGGALTDTLDFTSDAASTSDVNLTGTGGAAPAGEPLPSFSAGRTATKIRLVSLSEVAGGPWAVAADLDVIGEDGQSLSRIGATSEPSPSGYTILYQEDFEGGNLSSIDDLGANPTRFSNSTTRAHGGTHSLKVDYGVANQGQARIFLDSAVDEAYFQFWAYFDSGFVHDGHMFTVCGDSPESSYQCDGKSGQRPSGNAYSGTFASPDGWFYAGFDPEFYALHGNTAGFYPFQGYTYHPDMGCPADYDFSGNPNCYGAYLLQSNPKLSSGTGAWHKFTLHLKMNTISGGVGNHDGVQELWIDGSKADIPAGQGLRFRNASSIQIDAFLLPFYCPSCGAQVAYLDDITVWQQTSSPATTTWTTTADSQETLGESGYATNATDVTANGTPNTSSFWTTQWQGGSPGHPHTLTIDFGGSIDYTAIRYLVRQDGCDDGWIKDYRLEDTTDGTNWNVVRTGTFDYTGQTLGCFGASAPPYFLVSIGGGDPINHTPSTTQTIGGTTPVYYSTLRNCDPSANADCSDVGDLTISSVTASGDFAIASDGCTGQTVIPQQGCSIGTTFTPTASGQRTGVITVVTNGGTVTQALVGTGANPNPTQYTLNIPKSGTGSGTVTSSPAGINCGATCSANFNSGTTVSLTATPGGSSTFTTWSGCSSSTSATINVTMDQAKNCNAQFAASGGGGSCITFCSGFENGAIPQPSQNGWGDVYHYPESFLAVQSPVHSGSWALQVYGGPGLQNTEYTRGGKLEPFFPRGTEFWVRDWLYTSPNWTATQAGGHLIRVDTDGTNNGSNGWVIYVDIAQATHELLVAEGNETPMHGTGFFLPNHRNEYNCLVLHGIVGHPGTIEFYINGMQVLSYPHNYGSDPSPAQMGRIQFLSNIASNGGDQALWSQNNWLVLDDVGYNTGNNPLGCN